MWEHVRVDYITVNNTPEMVKLGRLLDEGKTVDLDGPVLPNEWFRRPPP